MGSSSLWRGLVLLSCVTTTFGLSHGLGRRAVIGLGVSLGARPSFADEAGPIILTEEEMEARVRRKQELLRQRTQGMVRSTEVPLDYNPEAGVNLRSKSWDQNLKESRLKQDELKKRNKAAKRDDLCEMLGRGC